MNLGSRITDHARKLGVRAGVCATFTECVPPLNCENGTQ